MFIMWIIEFSPYVLVYTCRFLLTRLEDILDKLTTIMDL